jgi:hypothetical protein
MHRNSLQEFEADRVLRKGFSEKPPFWQLVNRGPEPHSRLHCYWSMLLRGFMIFARKSCASVDAPAKGMVQLHCKPLSEGDSAEINDLQAIQREYLSITFGNSSGRSGKRAGRTVALSPR